MGIFETLFLIALVVLLLGWTARGFASPVAPTALRAPALVLVLMVVQIVVEGPRWPLYLPYILALIYFMVVRRAVYGPARSAPRSTLRRVLVGTLLCTVFGVSALLAYALPLPKIPTPSGPYKIGTVTYQFDDASRKDPYAPTPDQPRKIMLQVWYPAEPPSGAVPAAWSRDIGVFGPAIAHYFGLPSFFLDHLVALRSHAYEDVPVKPTEGGWPVLVYSHGWTGFRNVAQDEIEALVSQGYVVAAPDHPYGALATVLNDGTPILNNPKAMPPTEPKDARQVGIELLVDMYAGDVRFVIDQLQKLNAGELASPLLGRLDLGKLGVYGHSTGGGAIYEVAATDPRVKAAFGLDTWTEPISADVRAKPLQIPFYSLRSAAWAENNDAKTQILRTLLAQAQAKTYDNYIANSKHNDFTLMPVLSPLAGIFGVTGPIDGRRVNEITDAYLVAFFDQTLRGKPSPLLEDGANVYREVRPAPQF